jgi:hypothetical protein
MGHSVLVLGFLVSFLLFSSCIDDLAPEVGDLQGGECENEDSEPTADVSFKVDLLENAFTNAPGKCLSCHDPAGSTPVGYTSGGLNLSTYAGLKSGGANSVSNIAVEGEPCDSVLYQKVSPSPPFGSRMPQDGPPFLDEAALQIVSDWIAEGVDDN